MTPVELARQHFPDLDDDKLMSIMWNETSFPMIPGGKDPEEWLNYQLSEFKALLLTGYYIHDRCGTLYTMRCHLEEDIWPPIEEESECQTETDSKTG